MSSLHLSSAMLAPSHPSVRRDLADRQELHRTVMSLFPDLGGHARQACHVLYAARADARLPLLAVQSSALPAWSSLPPGYLLAAPVVRVLDALLASLAPGQDYAFTLSANVTRKVGTRDGSNGRRVPLAGPARLGWLDRQASRRGFEVLAAEVARTDRVIGRRQGRRVTFEETVFHGLLRVTQPDLFRLAVVGGIGPGKAYGFGLLDLAVPLGNGRQVMVR